MSLTLIYLNGYSLMLGALLYELLDLRMVSRLLSLGKQLDKYFVIWSKING